MHRRRLLSARLRNSCAPTDLESRSSRRPGCLRTACVLADLLACRLAGLCCSPRAIGETGGASRRERIARTCRYESAGRDGGECGAYHRRGFAEICKHGLQPPFVVITAPMGPQPVRCSVADLRRQVQVRG